MSRYITPKSTKNTGKPIKKATKVAAMGAGTAIGKAGKVATATKEATTLATALKTLGILL